LIHERSRGIPRLVNVICDNAMLTGFGLGRERIDEQIVFEVTRDFDLASPDAAPPVAESVPRNGGRVAPSAVDSNSADSDAAGQAVAAAATGSRRFFGSW
jgi:general secretion pathway protein A